ncbi:MAG TPA: hypothetical protein VNS09_14630 [Solirubrobacter sp.]|nr:hypothetical protein [Solirubrobacter sp.]
MRELTRRLRRSRARRSTLLLAALVAGLVAAPAASAAGTSVYFDVDVYPADYRSDGVIPVSVPHTGGFDGDYYVRNADTSIPTAVLQLRGGVEIGRNGRRGDPNAPASLPVDVLPGDVFQVINRDTGAVLAQTSFAGVPAITSSVLGQGGFAGGKTAGANVNQVTLNRRVARTERAGWTSGVYTWEKRTATGTPPSSRYDISELNENDSTPTYPSTADLDPNEYWYLRLVTPGSWVMRNVNRFEPVAYGLLTATGADTFAGAFAVPMAAGDYVSVGELSQSVVGDVESQVYITTVAPAGVVPPPDKVAPAVSRFDFGAPSTTVSSFLKSGLNTFVTLGEAGTVSEQLLVSVPVKAKKGKKGKKKPKAKTKAVAIGTGKGAVTLDGGTAKVLVKASKAAKKTLASLKGSKIKASLAITTTDAAGNTATVTRKVTLLVDTKQAKKKKK